MKKEQKFTISEIWEKQHLVLEILIILALSINVFLIAGYYDILEGIVEFSMQHEDWEIDEIITVSIFLVFAFAFFSMRRWQEVRKSEILLSQRNKELQKALSEIKQLRGIIPICSYCNKIYNDEGRWIQLEAYIHSHSDAKFSHGVCPGCYEKQMENL